MLYTRTKEDLNEILKNILNSLIEKCLAFDNGDREKAYELSGIIRTLLKHSDKGTSKSLLKQLSLREEIQYFQTNETPNLESMLSPVTVIVRDVFSLKHGIDYLPYLNDTGKFVSFDEWYNQIVLHFLDKYSYSRNKLIDTVAEKFDVHVDPTIDKKFHDLINATNDAIGWDWEVNGILLTHTSTPVLSSLRQVSHEILVSLRPHLSSTFDLETRYFSLIGEVKHIKLKYHIKPLSNLDYTLTLFQKTGDNYEVIELTTSFSWVGKDDEPLFDNFLEDKVRLIIRDEINSRLRQNHLNEGENLIHAKDEIILKDNLYKVLFNYNNQIKTIHKINIEASARVSYLLCHQSGK